MRLEDELGTLRILLNKIENESGGKLFVDDLRIIRDLAYNVFVKGKAANNSRYIYSQYADGETERNTNAINNPISDFMQKIVDRALPVGTDKWIRERVRYGIINHFRLIIPTYYGKDYVLPEINDEVFFNFIAVIAGKEKDLYLRFKSKDIFSDVYNVFRLEGSTPSTIYERSFTSSINAFDNEDLALIVKTMLSADRERYGYGQNELYKIILSIYYSTMMGKSSLKGMYENEARDVFDSREKMEKLINKIISSLEPREKLLSKIDDVTDNRDTSRSIVSIGQSLWVPTREGSYSLIKNDKKEELKLVPWSENFQLVHKR